MTRFQMVDIIPCHPCLQMIANFRFKQFHVVAPCGIETSQAALFLSPQWDLRCSKASSFLCIHGRHSCTANPQCPALMF